MINENVIKLSMTSDVQLLSTLVFAVLPNLP
jgi:hypothetical protein